MVGDGVPVLVSYQIINHGHDDAAKQAQDDASIAGAITGVVAGVVGVVFPPAGAIAGLVGAAISGIATVAGWIFGQINCDGMVLNDSFVANGNALNALTGLQAGAHAETRSYKGPKTPVGCGSDADYTVTWSVTVQPVPAIDLAPAGGPVQAVIINKNSGLCLDVPWGSAGDNIMVQQYPINNGNNQHWTITNVGNDANGDPIYTITSVASGKCLDVPNASTQDNIPIQQFQCNGGQNQQWNFIPVGNGVYSIRSNRSDG